MLTFESIGGPLTFQDHDPARGVVDRRMLAAARAHAPLRAPPVYDETPANSTYGDVRGGFLWEEEPGLRDYLHSWWLSGPGIVNLAGSEGWRPIQFEGAQPDRRYKRKVPARPDWVQGEFPKGWTGLASEGTDEKSQQENLHPDFWGLVAANANQSRFAGTHVYDLDPAGMPDRDRWARLQSAWTVLDLTPGGCGVTGQALAQNLGRGGRLDGGNAGYWPLCDHDHREVGIGAATSGRPGLVTLGDGQCVHDLGTDKDGRKLRPGHLHKDHLVIWPGLADGPWLFEPEPFGNVQPDGPHFVRGHIRFDREIFHQTCGQPHAGVWSVKVGVPVYIPDPDDRKPPPGDDGIPWIPEWVEWIKEKGGQRPETGNGFIGAPPIGSEEEGGDTGGAQPPPTGTGYVESKTPEKGPGETVGYLGGPSVLQYEGTTSVLTFAPAPWESYGQTGGSAPLIGDEGVKPAYPHVTGCLAAPGLILKASASLAGEANLGGALVLSDEQRRAFEQAPQVAKVVGYGTGDGTWGGFDTRVEGSVLQWADGPGGVLVIPAESDPAQVLEGTAEAPESVLKWVMPPDHAMQFFGDPSRTNATGVGAGVGIDYSAGDGDLRFTTFNADGTTASSVLLSSLAGGATGDVTGPGSAVDNALVRFDGTGGKNVQNSTGWTLSDAGVMAGSQLQLSTALAAAYGGTGLTSLGTAGQVLAVNSGGTALEFVDQSGGSTPGLGTVLAEDNTTGGTDLIVSAGDGLFFDGVSATSGSWLDSSGQFQTGTLTQMLDALTGATGTGYLVRSATTWTTPGAAPSSYLGANAAGTVGNQTRLALSHDAGAASNANFGSLALTNAGTGGRSLLQFNRTLTSGSDGVDSRQGFSWSRGGTVVGYMHGVRAYATNSYDLGVFADASENYKFTAFKPSLGGPFIHGAGGLSGTNSLTGPATPASGTWSIGATTGGVPQMKVNTGSGAVTHNLVQPQAEPTPPSGFGSFGDVETWAVAVQAAIKASGVFF